MLARRPRLLVLNQVALSAAGIAKFSFIDVKMSLAVLGAVTIFFGGLALRRLWSA